MESLVAPLVNLSILIGVMVFKLRDPLRDFIHQRHLSVRDELHAVRDELRRAHEKYEEFSTKLKTIDSEIALLQEQNKQDVAALKNKTGIESRRMAGIVVSDAKNAAGSLFYDLRKTLYLDLSGLVLDRAEFLLKERLTGDDRKRIRKEFSEQVETIQ